MLNICRPKGFYACMTVWNTSQQLQRSDKKKTLKSIACSRVILISLIEISELKRSYLKKRETKEPNKTTYLKYSLTNQERSY